MTARQDRLKKWSEAVNCYKFTKGKCEKAKKQLKEVYESAPKDEKCWCKVHLTTEGIASELIG